MDVVERVWMQELIVECIFDLHGIRPESRLKGVQGMIRKNCFDFLPPILESVVVARRHGEDVFRVVP